MDWKKIENCYLKTYGEIFKDIINGYSKISLEPLSKEDAYKLVCQEYKKNRWMCSQHQNRVSKESKKNMASELIGLIKDLNKCQDFETIFAIIDKKSVKGIGDVTKYDISLRYAHAIGKKELLPDKYVYVHSKLRESARKILNIKRIYGKKIDRSDFPFDLDSDDIENLLCLCHDCIINQKIDKKFCKKNNCGKGKRSNSCGQ